MKSNTNTTEYIPGFKPAIRADLPFDLVNLADGKDKQKEEKLTLQVLRGLKTDHRSCRKYLEDSNTWTKLAVQTMESKNTPWPNASNVKYPLVAMAALQFQSLVYPVLVHSPGIVRCQVRGAMPSKDGFDAAHRIGLHMSWQLLEQMSGWERATDRLLYLVAIIGTMFRKTFYNPDIGKNESKLVLPSSLIVNYHAESLESADRISYLFNESRSETYSKVATGYYSNTYLGSPLATKPDETAAQQKEADYRTGIEAPGVSDEATPYSNVEQVVRFDWDGDGYEEPLLVTVNLDSKKLLRVAANYQEANKEYDANRKLIRISPKQHYTQYGFIPNPDSAIYYLGFGQLVGPINLSINSVFNMLVDSGTLANTQAGLLARGTGLKKGQTLVAPGQFLQTDIPADKLPNAVFPIPIKEPSTVLFNLLQLIIEVGHRLSTTTDMQTGENPGQNQPATTTLAVREEGVKVFKSIYKRLHLSFKDELRILFALNKDYLDPVEYFDVVQPNADQPETGHVLQSDYETFNLRVVPYSDPTAVSSTARIVRQQARAELLQTGLINMEEHVKRSLESMDEPDITALMRPNPPQKDIKLQIAELKAQVDTYKTDMDSKIKDRQVSSEAVKDQAVAVLALAKAESEVQARKLDGMQQNLDALARLVEMSTLGGQMAQSAPTQSAPAEPTSTPTEEPVSE